MLEFENYMLAVGITGIVFIVVCLSLILETY